MDRNELTEGALVHDGIVIGRVDLDTDPGTSDPAQGAHITLNLGWMKMAGVTVTVLGDPEVDRKRGGIVLDR